MLRHFHATKTADFATALLSAAGFDIDALRAAGDTDALKTAIEQRVAGAVSDAAGKIGADSKQIGELQAKLDEALAAGSKLSEDAAAVNAALATAGVKLAADKPVAEALPAALEARISARAQQLLAATGTAPLADAPIADPSASGGQVQVKTRADFTALSPVEQAKFCALVRTGKAQLTD